MVTLYPIHSSRVYITLLILKEGELKFPLDLFCNRKMSNDI